MLTTTDALAPDGQPWNLVRLHNARGMTVTLMDWGASWLSARIPMTEGSVREALLGCAKPADYLRQDAYLGATVGRYANRIAGAMLTATGSQLAANQPPHQLHGGPEGFSHRRWQTVARTGQTVTYQLHSADGDQGFPGNLLATVEYRLEEDNTLAICWQATVDKPCPVNFTNHAYFNLDAVHGDARQHRLQLMAQCYLPVDSSGIPQRGLTPVAGSSFDFRQPKTLAQDFLADADQQAVKGYDHAFLLDAGGDADQTAAWLTSADGKLQLRVQTSAPALQLYSGNYLAGIPARVGVYQAFSGIALESGFLPDSPNHPEWPQPDCWLQPGEQYKCVTRYRFTPA
ncbi:galactose-1-epimerase [Erwinia sp. OLTSP20]|uniref:galactose-1-epimerase n=1 Tax=unclassified Erwinia TaxID=2622719 RepID=UPI000C1A492C|nr:MULTISPECIES: galactose-1-epimerase [unclassified Erwinia]PIJ48739.1 galactose-1-epimerase [Erwinia sp. OAMSP11]PIJ69364.1 galactose-1-epimerase [Erwinia sp. OLSSP12]PIJ79198.1 galactose-1-epimerase [Erwinia sp. OLCASP19]PIJ80724.1 galactose-1-epimerase [Erwinia sp. OLMTSP26]PIJ82874.1 galactose-1-epimerase [Erwinia sp. OLMDSP33]